MGVRPWHGCALTLFSLCPNAAASPPPSPLSHSIQSPELPILKAGDLVCRGPPDPRPHQSRPTGGTEVSKLKVWPVPVSLGWPGGGISKHHHAACLCLPSLLSGAETEALRGWGQKGYTEAEGLRPQEARVHVRELSVHLPWSQPPSCPGAGNGHTGRWTPSFRPPQPRGVGPSWEAGPLTRWPAGWASSQALTRLPAALAVAAPCRACPALWALPPPLLPTPSSQICALSVYVVGHRHIQVHIAVREH